MNLNILILIAGCLLSQNKENEIKNQSKKLPSFKDVLEVKHFIPGRIRMYCPIIKEDISTEEALLSTFNKIPGINELTVNSYTGSLLIKYDTDKLEPMLLIGIVLKILGLEESATKDNKSLISKESENLINSINCAIYEKTNGILDLKSATTILFAAYAAYDIKARPDVRPGGYTCIWWIYSLIGKK